MDGFETCRRLKAIPELEDVPVIFMTALSDVADKVKAFRAGGVDHVSKPFQADELLARIQTHLELREKRALLEKRNRELLALQKTKDDLTHMIVHDLRSPLSGICGYLEMLPMFETHLSPKGLRMVEIMAASAGKLQHMISSVLDVGKMEAGSMKLRMERIDLREIVQQIFLDLSPLCEGIDLKVESPSDPALAFADADPARVSRILYNLVSNAIKFVPQNGGRIAVEILAVPGAARVAVRDNGCGIPPDQLERVFDKYGQVERDLALNPLSTGLGLPFCKMAAELHGGRVWIELPPDGGTTVILELPHPAPRKGDAP
jgi:two-component system, sensor histidine kinase and response regulator